MYLEKRRQLWYACHDVPKSAQAALKTARFVQSLGTPDKAEAKRRAAILEARWRTDIARALAARPEDRVEQEARYWRRIYRDAPTREQGDLAERLWEDAWEDVVAAAMPAGIHDFDDPRLATFQPYVDAQRFLAIATGKLTPTDEHLDEYLATLKVAGKTVDTKRSNVRRFAGKFANTSDVERKSVQRWVNEEIAAGKAVKSMRRDLSDIRGYWAYLQAIQVAPEEVHPFDKLKLPKEASDNATRKPLTAAQVVDLHRAAGEGGDQVLADLTALGMWTGARLEELCALRVEHVGDGYFEVVDAKTAAGVRKVPVHDELKPLLERLTRGSSDGFVLSGLTLNKYGDRSNAIGKRFGRLKTLLGFGAAHVFHSIRKTVATQFENAGVAENVAADILGHDKPTMTYGVYSGGTSLEVRQRAIKVLSYPGFSPAL